MKVTACGIPRSGSTLVWQLLNDLFPNQVVPHIHPTMWRPDGSVAFVAVRNPHDVAASMYRVRLSRDGITEDTMIGLEAALHTMKRMFDAVELILKAQHALLRYEEFWRNYDVVFDLVEIMTRRDVPAKERAWLKGKFGLEANRARASTLATFNDIDPESHIHGDHVGPASPDTWRESLPEWAVLPVARFCKPIAKRWNYAH